MDVQLEELIERIKREAVDSAEKKAAELVAAAEKRSGEIISEAERKAAQIVAKANADSEKLIRTGNESLTQAGRDLILNLQTKITDAFKVIVRDEIGEALSSDLLEKTVLAVVSQWSSEEAGGSTVLLGEEDFDKLDAGLRSKLSDKLKAGLEIKPSSNIDTGFRITVEGGAAFYNFSVEEITSVLAEYLNPKLADLLRSAIS